MSTAINTNTNTNTATADALDRLAQVARDHLDPAPIRPANEITADIIAYFEDHPEAFAECLEELDSYNGYLGDDRYYDMYEIDELFSGFEPSEILARAFYGYDEDCYTTDSRGDRQYSEFCPNRDFFRFNAYGNLCSSDYKDYSAQLDRYAVEAMQDARGYIDGIDNNDEMRALFDELDAAGC